MAGRVEKVGCLIDWSEVIFKVLFAILGVLTAGLLVVIGFAIYDAIYAETISLRKDEWVCSREETRRVPQPVMVGKVLFTNYVHRQVCVEWKRSQ
jgi:hypothetical protein